MEGNENLVDHFKRNNVQPMQEENGAPEESAPRQIIDSLFPPPPAYYTRYTAQNIARYDALRQAAGAPSALETPGARLAHQRRILESSVDRRENVHGDEEGGPSPAPDWDILLEMEPPNVDWIKQDGSYKCFGEQWPIEDMLPSLEQMGMPRLFPVKGNRSDILLTLLRTLLKSYLSLVNLILFTPQEYFTADKDPLSGQPNSDLGQWRFVTQDRAREINDVCINITHLLNEIRPLQAREQLRDLMRSQLERRQQETKLIQA